MLFKILIFLLVITKGQSLQCIPLGVCECALEDGSGTVSLKGIPQNSDGSPVFFIDAGFYSYSYNPCKGFRGGQFENLAILQAADDGAYYDLGVQQNEYFNYTDGTGLYVHYQSASKQRTSRVQLVCNRDIENHLFYFIGELIIKEYDFVLEGPCACPGGCDENGVIVPVQQEPVSALKWNVVGYDLVSLILHDLLLIGFIIVAVVLMMYLCGLNVTCVE